MATTFFMRTANKTGFATLFARVQRPDRKIDIKQVNKIKFKYKKHCRLNRKKLFFWSIRRN